MKLESIEFLYHGSDFDFNEVDLSQAKQYKDFGSGYYLTSNLMQAQSWAQKKGKRKCYIYKYGVKDISRYNPSILELLDYNKEWVNIITNSRINGVYPVYDIIYDRIADNRYEDISEILIKYNYGVVTYNDVINKVRWKSDSGDQFCFRTVNALNCIELIEKITQIKDGSVWHNL